VIRVGKLKPKLIFSPACNDMGHFYPSEYNVSEYFWMELYDFVEKNHFGSFNMNPNLSKEQMEDMLARYTRRVKNPNAVENDIDETALRLINPWEYQLRYWIKKAGGSMLWQFNAVNKDTTDYVRQIVVLGESSLVRWTWFDAHVKYPALKLVARILNFLRTFKTQKEIDEWNSYLKTFREKK